MADHSASAAPMPGALKDYHDIAENIIDRKMKKMAEEHAPRNLESELEKPYEAWHDKVAFPAGWHPPKFRQFDGNGDAREHLVYFEAACGDTANTPSLLLRQFSASLKGPAFHWYSRLPAGSVRSWQTMKDLFKSHFISMSKDTSLLELSQIKQGRDEKIDDYIVRFRDSYVRLTREMHSEDAVDMCVHGMQQHWYLEVSRREPKTFSALGNAVAATKLEFEKAPHIMELYKNAGTPDYAKKFNSMAKPFNNGVKPKVQAESNTTRLSAMAAVPRQNLNPFGMRNDQGQRPRPSIHELLRKQYIFRRDLVKKFFNQLSQQGALNLPDPRRPDQMGMTDNPLFCPYHIYVGHVIEDCVSFKEWLQRAIDEKKLTLDPQAANPNYRQVNMVSINEADGKEYNREPYWRLFSEVEHQFEGLRLVPMISENGTQTWNKVHRRQYQENRYHKGVDTSSTTHNTSNYKGRTNPSRHPMPPRFVPRSEGDESFPRARLTQPTLGQFFPRSWKQGQQSVTQELRDEPETSTCNVSCNMVTSNGDSDDSEGEIVFTEHECKALGTNAISEENKREVNMNLCGGKDLAEPIRSRQYRLEKEKPIANRDATISKVQQEKSKEEEAKDHDVEYNIIAHLKRIPALLSVYDALVLLPELREALIKALQKPESYQIAMAKHRLLDNLLYDNQITFSEEYQMLDHGDHNRPLYIEGNVGAAHLRRILIDPGSAVNILPMRSLTRAGYILEDLGATEVVICGYDNHAKPALGVITLRLQMASYNFKVKFFVIEANASYSALLGRPWIHKYRVVPSTLHQCLKFMDKNGEQQCISGNTSPYTIQEVHHADAKYYFPSIEPGKQQGRSMPNVDVLTTPSTTSVTPSTTEMKFLIAPCSSSPGPSIGKLAVQNDKQEKLGIEGSMNNHVGKGLSTTAPILLRADNASTSTSPLSTGTTGGCTLSAATPILLKAHPSKDCAAKPEKESLGIMPRILSESLLMQPPSLYISVTTPLDVLAVQSANKRAIPTIFYKVPERQPCDDVYRLPNEGFEIEEALTTMKVEDRMIPLLRRAGILIHPNSRLPSPPVVCEEWWEQAEKLIKKGSNFHPKYGLGYHEEDSSDEEEGLHVTHGFNSCMIFESRKGDHYYSGEVSFDEDEPMEIYPSPHQPRSLRAAASACQGLRNKQYLLSSMHEVMPVAHGEVLDAAPAPPELEDGVELTVDELTEINLGTEDDPRPTYVSATLTNEEREEYKMFLMQYRDCFAWSYKEMRKPELVPYCQAAQRLMENFEIIQVNHVPRGENAPADALAKLASALTFLDSQSVQVRVEERWLLPAVLEVVQEEREVNAIVITNVEDGDWLQWYDISPQYNGMIFRHDMIFRGAVKHANAVHVDL
ncbi:hypothetical protein ACQ4PT_054248 [Festuca glaucescens]